jgi:hypothetical protein
METRSALEDQVYHLAIAKLAKSIIRIFSICNRKPIMIIEKSNPPMGGTNLCTTERTGSIFANKKK